MNDRFYSYPTTRYPIDSLPTDKQEKYTLGISRIRSHTKIHEHSDQNKDSLFNVPFINKYRQLV